MIDLAKANEIFGDRQRAYLLAFKEAAGKAVLADLAAFCRADESCIVSLGQHFPAEGLYAPVDRDRTFALEARREVYLRIMDHLNLSTEDLVKKYTRPAKGAISHDDETAPTD